MKRSSWAVVPLTVVLAGLPPLAAQVQGRQVGAAALARSVPVQGHWAATGALQNAREFNAQVLMADGKVLAMGGIDNNGNTLASAEVYSATAGVWTLTGSMAQARRAFPAVVLKSGKVLVSGGLGANSTVLGGAELYDPTTGTWSSAGALSVPRFGHTATVLLSGKVLVTGGCTVSPCSAATAVSELYDPASNRWSTTGSLNTARYDHTAVRLQSGKVLAIGGLTGAATTSTELYDPSTGTWSPAANTNVARNLNTSTLLPDGKVLVTGGTLSRYPFSSAELYDPSANTWTLTGTMTRGRYAHTATLLPDGTVLVAGGEGQSISCGKDCTGYIPTTTAEIYDEATGRFTATASLSQPLAYQSTTLLASGQALTDGGSGTTSICCVVESGAEVYTPLTMTFSASSLSFGVLQIGLTSAAQTITITNVSSHTATFSAIASLGDFTQHNTCPTTMNPGQSCTITVAFRPTAAGARNGAVILVDNDPGSPAQIIALTGIGATNAVTLLPSLSFPGQLPGASSVPQSITVYNDGAAAVNITAVGIWPAGSTFTQSNNCPTTLNPQTTCAIQVVFTPPDAGAFHALVWVANSAARTPAVAALTGIGLD